MPQLNFVKQGKGPTIVLSHALGCDLTMWDDVASLLQKRYTVLRYDHRGHGRSEQLRGPYSMEVFADDAAALIEEHSEGPVTFVGLVMGGMTGQQLAVRYPHLVSCIVMANSASYFDDSIRARLTARAQVALEQGMEAVADEAMTRWFSPAFMATPDGAAKAARLRAALVATHPSVYVASCEAMLEVDFGSSNPLIGCPTLVVAGTQDDSISVQTAEALCRSISGADLRTLDTGRMSAVERPVEFATLVHEFLKELKSR
ncbi:MAG: alpha/beta fold hydrolase [Ramlibacter sp.]